MRYILLFLMMLMVQVSPAAAQNFSVDPNAPHLEIGDDRIYYFSGGSVIEHIELSGLPFEYNVFDFDNGMIVHIPKSRDVCENLITPFTVLPQGRAQEVAAIGCKIIEGEKRLINRGDSMDMFYQKHCMEK